MNELESKNVLLGVTGSIAAYKIAHLTRALVKADCKVKIIMTNAASLFISPLTLSTLSKNKVQIHLFEDDMWSNHVELGLWADVFVIAPCTANSLAKLANGIADNILVASYLSAKCPVFIAPAMDLDMWIHPSTIQNISTLESYGNHIISVEHGELASGLIGDGRMAEPEKIISILEEFFVKNNDLSQTHVLITAGPTLEKIDPVRFISNHSSGKMGIALAEECASRGALVNLVLGPSKFLPKNKSIVVHHVVSAAEMFVASMDLFSTQKIALFTAAVADYTPKKKWKNKMKKGEGDMSIALERTKDIALELGKRKTENQITGGFALETTNGVQNAQIKLQKKHLDFIVLNSLEDKGAGFQGDTNKVTIISKDGMQDYPLKSKKKVAEDIVDFLKKYSTTSA